MNDKSPSETAVPADSAAESEEPSGPIEITSSASTSFAEVLQQLKLSLLVTTYQSGRIMLVRADKEGRLNTHLRLLPRPMGAAVGPRGIAIGTNSDVREYHNHGGLVGKLEDPDKHDACFVPLNVHVTGNIQIHEMAWGNEGLWIVNTRFSCLCALDEYNSFVPRWRPPFITGMAAEDRCHLNGLAMRDGDPAAVTAFSMTDTQQGWRENKTTSGLIMDYPSGEVVTSGLCMPHSPRFLGDQLWVLESGKGEVNIIDQKTGANTVVTQLPGFTRGLAFAADIAFVGLSQVRESNVFGGIPLVERVPERQCGVWIIRRTTGEVLGRLTFDTGVTEIFDVQIIPNFSYPDLLDLNDPLVDDSFLLPPDTMNS